MADLIEGFITTGPRGGGNHLLRETLQAMGFRALLGMHDGAWAPNASAKNTGTWNALRPAVQSLALGEFVTGHSTPFDLREFFGERKIIAVTRDPEAVAVSFWRKKKGQETTPDAFRRWVQKGGPLFQRFLSRTVPHYAWSDVPEALAVGFFEIMTADGQARICRYLGVDCCEAHVAGKGHAYTGRLSRPHEWFDDATRKVFWDRWHGMG